MDSEQKGQVVATIDSLHLVSSDIARASTLDKALDTAVGFVNKLVNCDQCIAYIRHDAEFARRCRKQSGSAERSESLIDRELSVDLAQYRVPIAVEETSGTVKFKVFNQWSTNPGETFICVPLRWRSEVVGAITIEHRRPHIYSRADSRLLSSIGLLVGTAIRTSQLQNQNSALRLELETQKLVARGKGILQRDLGISEHEAYLALQSQSQEKKRPIKEIAQAIILSAEIRNDAMHAVW